MPKDVMKMSKEEFDAAQRKAIGDDWQHLVPDGQGGLKEAPKKKSPPMPKEKKTHGFNDLGLDPKSSRWGAAIDAYKRWGKPVK